MDEASRSSDSLKLECDKTKSFVMRGTKIMYDKPTDTIILLNLTKSGDWFSKMKEDDSRPLKFYEAALFQLVNPKAWTISTMVASGFLPKDEKLIISILFISITALIICPISISIWAAFGSGIRNLVKNNKKKAIVEYFLAILLLITAILIVIDK